MKKALVGMLQIICCDYFLGSARMIYVCVIFLCLVYGGLSQYNSLVVCEVYEYVAHRESVCGP